MTSAPLDAVKLYIDSFNAGDAEGMTSVFDTTGILDGMPPHVWSGSSATRDWYEDVLVEARHHDASDYFVEIGAPLHEDVSGDAAYLAMAATMSYSLDGERVTQSGATITLALRRTPQGWRISAWAWTKGAQ